jgi:tetratricopeptide (TPR) repeat protein
MKKIQRSFLFFLVTSIYMGFLSLKEVNGQKKVDSTAFYYRLATNQKNSNDLIAGYRYFSRQKEISFSKKDSTQAVYNLRLLAIFQHKLGAFYESEATAVRAISILNKLKQTDKTREPFIGLYNHLGIIYSELRNYKKALEYYDKVLALATEPNHINAILNNKVCIYIEQEKYQKSKIEFSKIYDNSLNLKDER